MSIEKARFLASDFLSFDGLSALYEIARVLPSSESLEYILSETLEILSRRTGMSRSTISIKDLNTGEISVEAAYGIDKEKQRKGKYQSGEGVTGRVFKSGCPIAIPRLSDEPLFLDRMGARKNINLNDISFLCVPIKAVNSIIGTLSADRTEVEKKNQVLEGELRFLEAVADMIAQTVLSRQRELQSITALEEENLRLKLALEEKGKPKDMLGNSRPMREVYRLIAQVADSKTTVLIRGETGTGKELVARAIHQRSPRKNEPFIALNCGALPEPLLESELFGHEKGSFTGAVNQRIGHFEAAGEGTVFLDEVGELSTTAQNRLLRVIQEREFNRVGGNRVIKTSIRLITATNRDLEGEVRTGHFREDLYYRINVFPIHLPRLRERGADILLLADHFVNKYAMSAGKTISRISTPAIDMLSAYHWPGNVRELENVIERAVLLSTDGVLHGNHLPPTLALNEKNNLTVQKNFTQSVEAYEKELIVEVLKQTMGNQNRASELLGITNRILRYKVKKYNIHYKWFRKKINRNIYDREADNSSS